MEIARILEEKKENKIYGLMGNINLSTNNNNYGIVTEYRFKNTVKEYLNNKKDTAALKMVMLNEEYLNKKVDELSDSDIKRISFAKALLENKSHIILDYFEKGLNYKEKENFKRLFRKIANNYEKTIIIFTNDITFLWDITEEIIMIDEQNIISSVNKKDYFKIVDIVDKPRINKFIDLVRKKGIRIDNYSNTMDLLKAIYRIKGE